MLLKWHPDKRAVTMIARSISTLSKKSGMVIRVGSAARLATSEMVIDNMAIRIRKTFSPAKQTSIVAIGAKTQPSEVIAMADHKMRAFCCPADQLSKALNGRNSFVSAKLSGWVMTAVCM